MYDDNEEYMSDDEDLNSDEKFLKISKKNYVRGKYFENIYFKTQKFYSNDYQTCKDCLNYIYLICKDLNFINENNFKIYCTACIYFMIMIRVYGRKNLYYFYVDFKFPFKNYLVTLCLNCITFSFKVCKDEKLGCKNFDKVILKGKKHLNTSLFPFCELVEKDFQKIEYFLNSDRIIGQHIHNFIFIIDDPIKTLKILAPEKKMKLIELIEFLIKMYKNPFLCLYSAHEKCSFILSNYIHFEKRIEMAKIFF